MLPRAQKMQTPAMETIEYHILPVVRLWIARLSTATRYTLVACAVSALLEPLLLIAHLPLPGIACGLISTVFLYTGICLLMLLAAWSHTVLLAERGNVITRWLAWVGALLSPLAPICWGYTLFSGKLLLYRQGELPYILSTLLLVTALINLPRMAAAPWQLQVKLVLLPFLLLLVLITDIPGLVLACAGLKLLTAFTASNPLRQLAAAAPRIISLPPRG